MSLSLCWCCLNSEVCGVAASQGPGDRQSPGGAEIYGKGLACGVCGLTRGSEMQEACPGQSCHQSKKKTRKSLNVGRLNLTFQAVSWVRE